MQDQLDAGMRRAESRNQPGQQRVGGRADKAHAQRATLAMCGGERSRAGLFGVKQRTPGVGQRRLPGLGEAHPARGAHEQRRAQIRLQLADGDR
ncbi:hypothetical protein D3C85_1549450 [compost metagenome]